MENKLVDICIKILRLLPPGGLHFNAIFKQTGLAYKPDVVKAVKMLGKSVLIAQLRSPTHKQKKIQQLTELGVELVNLISDIERIHRSHSDLKRLLLEKFGLSDNLDTTSIKNELRQKGWSPKEIPFYHEFSQYAFLLITESLNMIYNILIYRCSELSLKHDIKNVAKLILNRIVLDALEYHILNAQDISTMRQLHYLKDTNGRTRIIMDRLISSVESIEERNPYLNRFTDKEEVSLLSSICCMLKVPKNVVEDYISSVNDTLRAYQEESLKDMGLEPTQIEPESYFVDGMMVKNKHKETRRISRRKISILQEMIKRSS